MKLLAKILLLTGGVIILSKIKQSNNTTNIGGYDTVDKLSKIWGSKIIYSSIPGLGFAEAIFESTKHLYKMNNS